MAFGLGTMRLPPDGFWAMTPRELAAAMRPFRRSAPVVPTRSDVAAMMRRYPDI